MKTLIFILHVIAISIISNYACYSAKDTLPPNPVCRFCPCCGGTHDDAYVEDMPLTYERSRLDTIILHKETFNYDFTYKEFRPGIDFRTNWKAEVHDWKKDAFIKITFIDVEGNDTTIQHYYYIKKPCIRPNLYFGIMPIGTQKEMDCWVINESSIADTITEIKFKDNNQGFEILDIILPEIIQSKDSVKFKVRYTATQNGEYRDSIGVESYCYDKFQTEVKARVGSSRIDVTNFDFGIRDVKSSTNCSILIWNQGITNLVVTGYIEPKQPTVFIPYFSDINENNPLVIKPKEVFSCEVMFIPSEEKIYADTISFISNTEKINDPDSIAELFGRGVSYPEINVSDAYFGNVFKSDSVTKIINVKNVGLKELIISSYEKPQNPLFINKFDREINPEYPLILQPGESWSFEIEFCSQNISERIQQNYIIFHSNAKKGDSTAFFRVDSVILGISDYIKKNDFIELSPNPADDFLSINFQDLDFILNYVKLFDSFGIVVYENRNIIESNLKINTRELVSGMYFLQVGNVGMRKVLVVH